MERRDLLTRFARVGAFALLSPRLSAVQDTRPRFAAPRLDVHTHIVSRDLVAWLRVAVTDPAVRHTIRPINGRILVDALEEDGVERAIALSSAHMHACDTPALARRKRMVEERYDVRNENDFTARQAEEYAPHLIPFASVNPKREYAVDEFVRCVELRKMRGLKVNFGTSDVRLRDPKHLEQVQTLFAEAARRNVPVVARVFNEALGDFGTEDLDILITRVVDPIPGLRLSIAHLGGGGGALEQGTLRLFAALIQAVRQRPQVAPRVWTDISSILLTEPRPGLKPISAAQQAALGTMLKTWGIDRLLWGSDTTSDRNPSALEQARIAWPLTEAEWHTMSAFDGAGFLARSGT